MCNDPNRWHCAGCNGCGNVHFPNCPYVKKSPDPLAQIAESLKELIDALKDDRLRIAEKEERYSESLEVDFSGFRVVLSPKVGE